jgi:hypothetical protein
MIPEINGLIGQRQRKPVASEMTKTQQELPSAFHSE